MIHLNIGSNLTSIYGSKFDNIAIAINLLIKLKIKIVKISNYYETPSYPNRNHPNFANIGLLCSYDLGYNKLFKEISLIEKKLGRKKSQKNDPRICDIDIIDFNSSVHKDKNVELPHPRAHIRNFVLYPIKEIDPNWTHPIIKIKVDKLISQLAQKSRIEITRLNKSVII